MAEKPTTIPAYIERLEEPQRAIVATLHELIMKAAPAATHAIKWAQPVYETNGPFAYIRAFKNHVTFGFWRGTELSDPDGVLEGDGDRMKHMKLRDAKEIRKKVVQAFVKEAVHLNETLGNPTRAAAKKA